MSNLFAVRNAQSIGAIPSGDFPDNAARFHLMMRALAGEEVYAYQPVGSEDWVLWIYDGNPAHENRWSIQQYTEQFNLERSEKTE